MDHSPWFRPLSVEISLEMSQIFTCAAINMVNLYKSVKRVYNVCRAYGIFFSIYLEAIDCEIQWEYVHHQSRLVQLQADRSIVKSQ